MPKNIRSKRQATKKRARRPAFHPFNIHVTLSALMLVGGIVTIALALTQPLRSSATTCSISDKLVNSCRPWLSAAVGGYSQVAGDQQFEFFNKRLNNPGVLNNPNASTSVKLRMDFPHVYHAGGASLFSGGAQKAISDTSLYGASGNPILVNWKPGNKWRDTANGAADASIAASAKAVKALGQRKIFLTLWHEPENHGDVSAEGVTFTSGCKRPDGTRGSAADYRDMWRHVRQVFEREGVSNVVWFMNYTGYVGNNAWDCLVKPLYPGNDLVDWVMWDPYSSNTGQFVDSISKFYNFLSENSDSTHNFKSKPWGLAEFGSNSEPAKAAGYWREGAQAMGTTWATNRFPNIKLYAVFDTSSNGGTNGGLRVGYDVNGQIDANEQSAFNAFAQSIINFKGEAAPAPTPEPSSTPAKDTVPPTVSVTEPVSGETKSGKVTVRANASDDVGVSAVTLRVDDQWVETDNSAPYSFVLDTARYANGQHTLVVRAWDKAGNMAQSKAVTLVSKNGSTAGQSNTDAKAPAQKASEVADPTATVLVAGQTVSRPVDVSGIVVVEPTVEGNSIRVWVDGEQQPANTVDTTKLTNGVHTLRVEENGHVTEQKIRVNNPFSLAVKNELRENASYYLGGIGITLGGLGMFIGRILLTRGI